MNSFSSFVSPWQTVVLTRDEVLEDSSFPWYEIGSLSARLCFGIMQVYGVDEGGIAASPYAYISRFLKGSIPTWRLDEHPALGFDTECGRAVRTLRKFLRAVRSNRRPDEDLSFVAVNAKSGRVMVVVRCKQQEVLWGSILPQAPSPLEDGEVLE